MKKFLLIIFLFLIIFNIQVVNAKEYNPYKKPLNNQLLQRLTTKENDIEIVRNKYISKSEVQDFCNGYEYLITNKSDNDIILKNVASTDFISQQEIAKKVVSINYSDFIPIFGLVRGIRTDIEKNKFTRSLPRNYVLKPSQTVRILALSYINKDPKADFYFLINNKEYKFTSKGVLND